MDVQYEYIMALVKITEDLNKNFAHHIYKKFDFNGTRYRISIGNSNNCDHIFDILNMFKDNYNIPIKFDTLGVDLSLINLFENCYKNIIGFLEDGGQRIKH